ncbi:hypothetical protein PPSIR1_01247 [Plesiocystis pacifica SIR-1]|uniref:Uncharacterized protein n=1 Tax=Plesiocystis pacifica SIR-1 TaxID=391625 RepID=A6GHX4_9BACT|nr:hypothetical protein [Plesiocystis pacifica]EDM74528.1 hypothetical protein PPSIR1_01247 [Plesiocystis pacifica SIR-1]
MEPIAENENEQPEGATAGEAKADDAPGMKKVEGRDRETVELKRQYEAEVEAKVSSDHAHIILAYGVIWVLFAIYGVTLWWRSSKQQADLDALRKRTQPKG